MRILVIDDESVSRLLLKEFLQVHGTCDVAKTGTEALELFNKSIADNKKYDLVCTDIIMPEMDGIELLKRLREIEFKQDIYSEGRACKIIMTTGVSDLEKIMESFDEYCDDYLVKPIRMATLKETLKKLKLIK